MATVNSTEYGNAVATPVVPNSGVVSEGRMRWAFATLDAAHGNTLAQDDLVNLFELPAGSKPVLMTRSNGAFGASVTLSVGYEGDDDAFESAVAVATAANTPVLTAVDDASVLASKVVVQAKLGGANPADNVQLTVGIGYISY